MEKKILLEINRMKEIMGMNIIVEAASPIIDVLIRSLEKVFEKTEDKEVQTALAKYGDASGNALERKLNAISTTGKKGAEKKLEAKLAIANLATQLTESELMNMFMKIPRTEWESLGVMTSEELAEIYLVNFRNRGVYDRIKNTIDNIQTADGFNKYIKQLATNLKVSEDLATEIVGQFNRDVYDRFVTSQFERETVKTTAQLASDTLSGLSQEQKQYYLDFLSKIKNKEAYSKFVKETASTLKVSEEVVDEMFISISPTAEKFTERFGGSAFSTPIERFSKGEIGLDEYLDEAIPAIYEGTGLNELERGRISRMWKNPESKKKFKDEVINTYKGMSFDKQVEELVKLTKGQSYWPGGWENFIFFIKNNKSIINDFCVTGKVNVNVKTGLFALYGTPQQVEKDVIRNICKLVKFYAINLVAANVFKLYAGSQDAADSWFNRALNIYFQISTWDEGFETLWSCATKQEIQQYITTNGPTWKEGTDYYFKPGFCDEPQLIVIKSQGKGPDGKELEPKLMAIMSVNGVMTERPYEETAMEQFGKNIENWKKKVPEVAKKAEEKVEQGIEQIQQGVEDAKEKANTNQNSVNRSNSGGGLGTGTGPG